MDKWFIEKSKLNIADMLLIPLDRVTYFPSKFGVFYLKITKRYSKIGFSRKWLKDQKPISFFLKI